MEIVEKIAMWGGFAGVIISLFGIIVIYLTRSNIIDLLDKDAIMYDKVFELKKTAFQNAFDILDYYEIYGLEIRSSKNFIQKAKSAYNELMCTARHSRVYEEFYRLTLDPSFTQVTIQDIANFKNYCRYDLGATKKKSKFKKTEDSPVVSQLKTSTNPVGSSAVGSSATTTPAPRPRPQKQTPTKPKEEPSQENNE